MSDHTVLAFKNPEKNVTYDALTDLLRHKAQELLAVAIEAEVASFIEQHQNLKLPDGKQRIVRNGYLPEREILTSIGSIPVKAPRVRDQGDDEAPAIRFTSHMLPKYMRRTATLDVMLPILYLKGISTGDFASALEPMLGPGAKSITPKVISSLKASWIKDFERWQGRRLDDRRYVYWWADGVYFQARLEDDKRCLLVIVAADEFGNKHLLGMMDGYRESKASWAELLHQLQGQGLEHAPLLATGDGGLGFWGALNEVFPEVKQQRCWVHKTANVLDKLPKSQQSDAHRELKEIYLSASRLDAKKALKGFEERFGLKYPKAVECLVKDEEALLAFYDYPAEHWVHLRTTNPIESTFATVRHRTKKSKGCFSRDTIMGSVFKLFQEAQKRWSKLNGIKRIAQVIEMKEFVNGELRDEKANELEAEELQQTYAA